jgi:hypothetical protein
MAAPLHSRDSWSRIPPEFETATDATIISKRLSIGGLALDLLRKGNSGPGPEAWLRSASHRQCDSRRLRSCR